MRDDVVIVLNEREPLKHQLAEELEATLHSLHFSCTRITPTSEIAEILDVRRPRVVVLDYLIGDYATALDILQVMRARPDGRPSKPIVWTDETSVGVAVEAMKLGAQDFIEMGITNSLSRVTMVIQELLKDEKRHAMRPPKRELIFHTAAGARLLAKAETVARNRNTGAIVLLGECGSGKSSIARFIHENRPFSSRLVEFDIQVQSPETLPSLATVPVMATLHLDNLNVWHPELFHRLEDYIGQGGQDHKALLIISTSTPSTAQKYARLIGASDILEIPALRERKEDLAALFLRFCTDAQPGKKQLNNFSTDLIDAVHQIPWPGNVRQLRAAITEATSIEPKFATLMFEEFEPSFSKEINCTKLENEEKQLLFLKNLYAAACHWQKLFYFTSDSLSKET